jgi:hypothetical protein
LTYLASYATVLSLSFLLWFRHVDELTLVSPPLVGYAEQRTVTDPKHHEKV